MSAREKLSELQAVKAEANKIPIPPLKAGTEHPASVAARKLGEARKALGDVPFPMTLDRACDLVGNDVEPSNFVATAFEAIARDIDGLSTLAEHESSQAGFDGWCMFQHLAKRARFAAEVAAFIAGPGTDDADEDDADEDDADEDDAEVTP